MILPFMTEWADGTPTNFTNKIWASFAGGCQKKAVDNNILHMEYSNKCLEKMGLKSPMTLSIGNFKPKLHTIRAGNRWKAGMKIHFAINPRSKDYFQFAPVIFVKSVQEIVIERYKYSSFKIFVDGKELSLIKRDKIAFNDGFTNVYDIRDFFVPNEGDIFKGQIVHWTDLKY